MGGVEDFGDNCEVAKVGRGVMGIDAQFAAFRAEGGERPVMAIVGCDAVAGQDGVKHLQRMVHRTECVIQQAAQVGMGGRIAHRAHVGQRRPQPLFMYWMPNR